jgi:hypothetical protein
MSAEMAIAPRFSIDNMSLELSLELDECRKADSPTDLNRKPVPMSLLETVSKTPPKYFRPAIS